MIGVGDSFARAMASCAPFEPRPLLAVAVSGGADSLALVLLAAEWARARRGRAVALTVDHGLRAGSRAEARRVARWLNRHGIVHEILRWRGPKPKTGLQAAAREARYRLLTDWCRSHGALHLLLGHTRDDQAETVLLRLAAGSGPHGLAAMPLIQESAAVRMLRPLLGVPHSDLTAFLRARKQDWIEDPSNRDPRFARIRVRGAAGEVERAALAAAAAELGRFRARQERAIANTLARAAQVHPEGYAELDVATLAAAAPGVGWRALAALLATIGGLAYPPRGDAVRGLYDELSAGRLGRGRTLARCRLIPAGGRCLLTREARDLETRRIGGPTPRVSDWDGRFAVSLARARPGSVGALGEAGWAEAVARKPALRRTTIPYPARLTLPAVRDRNGVAAVPALGYARPGSPKITAIIAFRPQRSLGPAVFAAPDPA